jgi:hypothetical protein
MCYVWLSEQTVTFALHIINRFGSITKAGSVYCAVRTESLYKTDTFRLWRVISLRSPACWVADNRAKQSLPYLSVLRNVSTNDGKTKLQPPRKDRYRTPDDKHGTETWKQVYCYVILPVQYVNECRCTGTWQSEPPALQNNLLHVPDVRLPSARRQSFLKGYGLLWRNHRRWKIQWYISTKLHGVLPQKTVILFHKFCSFLITRMIKVCAFISDYFKKYSAKVEHWPLTSSEGRPRKLVLSCIKSE